MENDQLRQKSILPVKFAVLAMLVSVLAWSAGVESTAAKRSARITVSAGSFDRRESVVSFELPPEFREASYALRDDSGHIAPLQIDSRRQATFVLAELKAGATKTYQLIPESRGRRAVSRVDLTTNQNRLDLGILGRQAFSFVGKPLELPGKDIKPVFLRGGYLHPIYSPSGRLVTDDYPPDHYHHHGIWFAWTKTQFDGGHPDFWNVGDGTGRVDFEAVDATWSGPVHAGFLSRQSYIALTGGVAQRALNEQWDVRLYNVGHGDSRYFMFDIVATQQCATSSPLILEEYRYGGMGVRGHRDWKDKSKVSFLTSEGKTRENGNATRGRWCRITGPVDSQLVGIAILDHPANVRSPQPMRVNPDDPFFNYAPSQLGQFEIKPGEKLVLRYRYIVSDGPADVLQLDSLWNDYAHPPEVVVSVK
ncbi:MAG: PmoA family protein [Pyrinomonadaceae bacterium]|nr:PmoA family protein [Pyrinomonadaceae bacterium]